MDAIVTYDTGERMKVNICSNGVSKKVKDDTYNG